MTPANNLWRIQGELVELLEAREELLCKALEWVAAGRPPCDKETPEECLDAIESGIQAYVRDKLVQVDDLREPLIALAEGVELCKKRAAAETNRAMVLQNRYDRLKDSIKQAMQWLEESGYWKPKQTRKLESPHGSFTLKGNGGAQPVEITDEALVPDEYCRVRVTMPLRNWKDICVTFNEDHEFLAECNPGPREVSKSAVAEALAKPCPQCKGHGGIAKWDGKSLETLPPVFNIPVCAECGGSGNQGVPGARLAPRGESVVVK